MQAFQNFSMTTWKNPTKHAQTFELHQGPGSQPMRVTIQPGDAADVPSIYDDAIRTERGGVVVGGLAPLLIAEGRATVPVHEALAKAAALGDVERRLVASTGASAGTNSLDPIALLDAKNRALEAKVEQLLAMRAPSSDATSVDVLALQRKNAELEARLDTLMAAMTEPKAPARTTEEPLTKPPAPPPPQNPPRR